MNGRRASRGMAVVRPIASAVLRTALTPKADILERSSCPLSAKKQTFTDPQHGTKLIGQCRDRHYFNYKVGMRERRAIPISSDGGGLL